jgi:hypothetical protein
MRSRSSRDSARSRVSTAATSRVRRWWSNLLDALPDYTAEVEELEGVGAVTIGRIRGRAHGAGSSAPVVETWWQLIRWRDGKCIWWRNFATEAEAVEAIRVQAG